MNNEDRNQSHAFALSSALSRRDLLRRLGYGAGGLALLAAQTGPAEALQRLLAEDWRPQLQGRGGLGSYGGYALQLPFWSDGAGWNAPEYYETIQAGRRRFPKTVQSADIDGDGRDELLVRGPQGILVQKYDPVSNQWTQLPDGPGWSDATGWNQPEYNSTIQTADIDGDGQAELLGRGADGLNAWKYDSNPTSLTYETWVQLPTLTDLSDSYPYGQPWWNRAYYPTIQCADIDGDNKAEVLARHTFGIMAWRYNPGATPFEGSWRQLPYGPMWTDRAGWNRDLYNTTIQCADIDGDGQAELLGRGADGLNAWKYDSNGQWTQLPTLADVSDSPGGWTDPKYYATLQCADIDGDGRAELLGRGFLSFYYWKYDPDKKQWSSLGYGPPWSNAAGWDKPEYYNTIQTADIDGDGRAELLGRAPDSDPNGAGLQVWKFDPARGSWRQLPGIGEWSDANGWNGVPYYSVIQSARALWPGDPRYTGDGKSQAILLGRSIACIETHLFDTAAGQWQRAIPFPEFTGARLTAYQYITAALNIRNVGAAGIRGRYNDETAPLSDWRNSLLGTGSTPIAPPSNISSADWLAVRNQIVQELTWVAAVQDWYGAKTNGLISATYQGKDLTVQTIGDYLKLPASDDGQVALSILGLLFSGAAAVLGLPALAAGTAAAIAGILGAAFTAAASFYPNGGDFDGEYAQLQATLTNAFGQALSANGDNQFHITGGMDQNTGQYNPGNYGLLAAIGRQIESTAWNWPATTDDLITGMQRSYAISLWQALIGLKWKVLNNLDGSPGSGYPDAYKDFFTNSNGVVDFNWIGTSCAINEYPPIASLAALLDPPQTQQIFPLGAPVQDVCRFENGWPNISCGFGRAPGFQPDLEISSVLRREPETNELLVALELYNAGLKGAVNVEITQARLLHLTPVAGSLPTRHTHIRSGRTRTLALRFPASRQLAAFGPQATVPLRLSGRYLGGAFAMILRVRLP